MVELLQKLDNDSVPGIERSSRHPLMPVDIRYPFINHDMPFSKLRVNAPLIWVNLFATTRIFCVESPELLK